MMYCFRIIGLFILLSLVSAKVNIDQNDTSITLANDRLTMVFNTSIGAPVGLFLDDQDLLGKDNNHGPYMDCYCTNDPPSGHYTPGSTNPEMALINGTDATGTDYIGAIMSENYTQTGQTFQQYWFIRDGETGIHTFSRIAYYNESVPFLRNLQEFRTLIRPNTTLWTHLSSTDAQTAPLPSLDAIANQVDIQDATWRFNNTPNDAYYSQFSEYFTKYTFSTDWRKHSVHGLYADGSTSNGLTYGMWLVMNTKDTYYGGPIHSDLTVDGAVYNYLVSNHHGEGTPNITFGFDKTFGPQYYYFNGGTGSQSLKELKSDAQSLADPNWNSQFYDSISQHVPGYAPSDKRGSVKGLIKLPDHATNPIAILTVQGKYFQDNSVEPNAYQYWTEIDKESGTFEIDRVKEGNYRLTVYADGVFGNFEKDSISIKAKETNTIDELEWQEESSGTKEIFRLGIPDKSSGEYKHGSQLDLDHPLHPPEYLIYWGNYDWQTDFPNGINFTVGKDDPAHDLNVVHWSVFGPTPDNADIEITTTNNWTINFEIDEDDVDSIDKFNTATFSIQLAGAKTSTGNTDLLDPSKPYNSFVLETFVNGQQESLKFPIQHTQSSSCIVRSAVSCYQIASKLQFPANWLHSGLNSFLLHIPYNATPPESAVLPGTIYVQYDAFRLELD